MNIVTFCHVKMLNGILMIIQNKTVRILKGLQKNIIGDDMFETSTFLKKAAKIFLVFLLIKFSGKHSEALLASVILIIGQHTGFG